MGVYGLMVYQIDEVPDHFEARETCIEVVEMCNEIMRTMPEAFHHIPDHFKTQKMCDKAFEEDFFSLKFIPDWFVRPQQVNLWYYDYYDYGGLWDDDDEAPGWYEGYQKRKSQKSKNKRRTI